MHGYEFYFEKAKRLELELADLKMTCEQNVTSWRLYTIFLKLSEHFVNQIIKIADCYSLIFIIDVVIQVVPMSSSCSSHALFIHNEAILMLHS